MPTASLPSTTGRALLIVPGLQAHGVLVGADQESPGWLADTALNSAVVPAASIAFLVPAALLRIAPWPPDDIVAPVPGPRPGAPGATVHPSVTAIERLGEQGVSRHA